MQNFDLNIETEGASYLIRARIEGAEATHPFEFPFTDMELENLLLRMGTGQHGVWRRSGDAPELQAAKEFGGVLFEALFTGSVRDLLRRTQSEYPALRLRLAFTRAPALANLPWEFLYDREENMFLALSNTSPIVRYLEQPRRVAPLTVAAPLRLLVIIAAPVDLETLEDDTEWHNLQTALAPLIERGILQIDRLTPPTFAALQMALRSTPYHLLHFVGHGAFDSSVQDGVLFLEDERRHSQRTNGQSLGFLLRDYRATLRFVFLNVCEGGKTAINDPFAGVAQSLIQQGIAAVLAMQSAVRDDYALTVARTFYTTLTDNVSLENALTAARLALFAETQRVEWGIPVLYTRTQEGTLFTVEATPVMPTPKEAIPTEPAPRSVPTVPIPVAVTEREPSSALPSSFAEILNRIQQKFCSLPGGDVAGQPSWSGIFLVLLAVLLFGGGALVQAIFNNRPTPSPTPNAAAVSATQTILAAPSRIAIGDVTLPSTATPDFPASPTDRASLADWLVQATHNNRNPASIQQVLIEAGYLSTEPNAWRADLDLTGDSQPDWVLTTRGDDTMRNELLIIDPTNGAIAHNSRDSISGETIILPLRIDDITGDTITDVLYSVLNCQTLDVPCYHSWSLEGGAQNSDMVAYLRLLEINDTFAAGRSQTTLEQYKALAYDAPLQNTAWGDWEADREISAVLRFAGARLIIASYLESGNDGGYYDRFKGVFGESDPYMIPLGAMMGSVNEGDTPNAACAAFRIAVTSTDLTYPLYKMGQGGLTEDDVCPL